MSTFATYPPTGGGSSTGTIMKYATFSLFPSAASSGNGAFAVALDTNVLYESNGTSWLLVSTPPFTTGNLTDVGTDGIVVTGGSGAVIGSGTSIAQTKSDATHNGYLSSTDWSTFNGKQAAGNYITDLTGDGTASGPGSAALTLATVNPSPGTYNRANITVNNKGLVTAAFASATGNIIASGSAGLSVTGGTNAALAAVSISQQPAAGSQNGYLTSIDWTTFNNKQTAGNYITALTGDITASGPGSAAATLAATTNSTLTTLSGLTTAASLATVGTITSGTWSGTTIALNKGGTGQTTKAAAFDALSPMTTLGDVTYGGASGTGTRLAGNTTSTKNFLTQTGTGSVSAAPAWGTIVSADISTAMTPSNMSDAMATILGCKTYLSTGSYSGGGAPTLTLASGGGSLGTIYEADFQPRQDQAGNWWLKFNINVAASSASRTELSLNINGVSFYSNGATTLYNAITASSNGSAAYVARAFTDVSVNAGNVKVVHASATTTEYSYSGNCLSLIHI